MRRAISLSIAALLMLLLAACSGQNEPGSSQSLFQESNEQNSQTSENSSVAPLESTGADQNILIAYFTRLDNTDATLDEIIQGGGPYGSLGDSFESADVDAIVSASITVVNGQAQGNVETMAQMIQNTVGGDLFSIQTADSYPVNYDELIDLGGEEKSAAARPELSTQMENMADYDVIFLGYPNWWYDMQAQAVDFPGRFPLFRSWSREQ